MEKNSIAQRKIIVTEDGSFSLKLDCYDEQFHSIHGAVSESRHIFIDAGLKAFSQPELSIFEMGFGTGINALLTFVHGHDQNIDYHTIEAFPLEEDEYLLLHNVELIYQQCKDIISLSKAELQEVFLRMHRSRDGERVQIAPNFSFTKEIVRLEDKIFRNNTFDLIYFDAFSPNIQPHLWSDEIFEKIFLAMRKNGIFTTYCAKGVVKRSLKKAGFTVEGLPGPVGKREITRARKFF